MSVLDGITAQLDTVSTALDRIQAAVVSLTAPKAVFVPMQLFGPAQNQNGLEVFPIGTTWQFLNPLSANCVTLDFDLPLADALRARWLLIWTPNNIAVESRLIAFDYAVGGANIVNQTPLGSIVSLGHQTPVPQAVYFTDELNALRTEKKTKQIGMQFRDDGVTPWTLYESCLEVHWKV